MRLTNGPAPCSLPNRPLKDWSKLLGRSPRCSTAFSITAMSSSVARGAGEPKPLLPQREVASDVTCRGLRPCDPNTKTKPFYQRKSGGGPGTLPLVGPVSRDEPECGKTLARTF